MLLFCGIVVSVLLILIIFVRTPQDNTDLSSFGSKSGLFGSPGSAQQFLDFLTLIGTILYLVIVLKLNLEHSPC